MAFLAFGGEGSVELAPPSSLTKTLAGLCKADGYRAKAGEVFLYHAPAGSPAARVIVAGLGPRAKADLESLRLAVSAAARRAAAIGARRLAVQIPPGAPYAAEPAERVGQALAEGVLIGLFHFDRYKTGKNEDRKALAVVDLFGAKEDAALLRKGVARGEQVAAAVNFAREIVNEPAKEITPLKFASIAVAEAKAAGLRCRVLRLPELRKLGMEGILGVSRGSAEEPCLIHLRYTPKGKPRRKVALIGKGITFDSGGLSLKTATGMETMKADKSGATAVLAVLRALPQLGTPVQVDGVMAMSENLPSGTAQKPGDVLRMFGGKTVEVMNTDAEGRLVLADALEFAARLEPDTMIDLATLTGAVVIALGPLATGVMGNDRPLSDALCEAGRAAGEKLWPLPLYDEYADMLRSPVADMKNTGDRHGGALTAGLFLREFVRPGIPWAHLDIAGPAFLERDHGYLRRGATGAGVRTILHYLDGLR
jgi:leucyl aminopeptidase